MRVKLKRNFFAEGRRYRPKIQGDGDGWLTMPDRLRDKLPKDAEVDEDSLPKAVEDPRMEETKNAAPRPPEETTGPQRVKSGTRVETEAPVKVPSGTQGNVGEDDPAALFRKQLEEAEAEKAQPEPAKGKGKK